MALKLNMSKAYDRVEWGCLDKIMEKLGFNSRWRSLMSQCISTVTYSIRINGKQCGQIAPTRGLRQGDPLSPYLFLLCAEGLSAMIKKAMEIGKMEGISICRGVLRYPIFFSLTIASFSARCPLKNVMPFSGFSVCMRTTLVNN